MSAPGKPVSRYAMKVKRRNRMTAEKRRHANRRKSIGRKFRRVSVLVGGQSC